LISQKTTHIYKTKGQRFAILLLINNDVII
jgi:hypothetical protein